MILCAWWLFRSHHEKCWQSDFHHVLLLLSFFSYLYLASTTLSKSLSLLSSLLTPVVIDLYIANALLIAK
jgi:hypothetical protein